MPAIKNQLYFIAIIPPSPLKDEIRKIKLEVQDKFHSSHSLNAPPHITLLSPFRLDEENADKLNTLLEGFSQDFELFDVHFNNFSTFPPRVIFIDVEKTPGLLNFQQKLEKLARSNPEIFHYNYDKRPYHPHLTLAFKDLTKSNFYRAWKEFEPREFKGCFEAEKFSLLKHNGERWDVVGNFGFNKNH